MPCQAFEKLKRECFKAPVNPKPGVVCRALRLKILAEEMAEVGDRTCFEIYQAALAFSPGIDGWIYWAMARSYASLGLPNEALATYEITLQQLEREKRSHDAMSARIQMEALEQKMAAERVF